jgi:hypothetical protein
MFHCSVLYLYFTHFPSSRLLDSSSLLGNKLWRRFSVGHHPSPPAKDHREHEANLTDEEVIETQSSSTGQEDVNIPAAQDPADQSPERQENSPGVQRLRVDQKNSEGQERSLGIQDSDGQENSKSIDYPDGGKESQDVQESEGHQTSHISQENENSSAVQDKEGHKNTTAINDHEGEQNGTALDDSNIPLNIPPVREPKGHQSSTAFLDIHVEEQEALQEPRTIVRKIYEQETYFAVHEGEVRKSGATACMASQESFSVLTTSNQEPLDTAQATDKGSETPTGTVYRSQVHKMSDEEIAGESSMSKSVQSEENLDVSHVQTSQPGEELGLPSSKDPPSENDPAQEGQRVRNQPPTQQQQKPLDSKQAVMSNFFSLISRPRTLGPVKRPSSVPPARPSMGSNPQTLLAVLDPSIADSSDKSSGSMNLIVMNPPNKIVSDLSSMSSDVEDPPTKDPDTPDDLAVNSAAIGLPSVHKAIREPQTQTQTVFTPVNLGPIVISSPVNLTDTILLDMTGPLSIASNTRDNSMLSTNFADSFDTIPAVLEIANQFVAEDTCTKMAVNVVIFPDVPVTPIMEAVVANTPVMKQNLMESSVTDSTFTDTNITEEYVSDTHIKNESITGLPSTLGKITETLKIEETGTNTASTDTPATETLTADTPATDSPTGDTPASKSPTADIPAIDAQKAENPTNYIPTAGTPVTDNPSDDTPATDTPTADTPATDTEKAKNPANYNPTEDTPATGNPSADAPATDTPTADTPATDIPTADTPATDTPTADTPAIDTPTADTPATETPTEDNPVTETPTPDILTIDTQKAENPATNTPTADTPAINTQKAENPATNTPTADTPAINTQKAENSANETFTEDTPLTDTPTADNPATCTSTGDSPVILIADTAVLLPLASSQVNPPFIDTTIIENMGIFKLDPMVTKSSFVDLTFDDQVLQESSASSSNSAGEVIDSSTLDSAVTNLDVKDLIYSATVSSTSGQDLCIFYIIPIE